MKMFNKVVHMGKLTSIVIALRSQGFNCLYRYSIQNKRLFFVCLFACIFLFRVCHFESETD